MGVAVSGCGGEWVWWRVGVVVSGSGGEWEWR